MTTQSYLTFDLNNLFEKYFNDNNLNENDIEKCKNILQIYLKKIEIKNYGNNLKHYCQNNFDFDCDDINIYNVNYYETYNNEYMQNLKNINYEIDVSLGNSFLKIVFEKSDELSFDGKNKYLFYNFIVEGNYIIKKEKNGKIPTKINILYLENLLIDYNYTKMTPLQFIKLFLSLFSATDYFQDVITDITNNTFTNDIESNINTDDINSDDNSNNSDTNENIDKQ